MFEIIMTGEGRQMWFHPDGFRNEQSIYVDVPEVGFNRIGRARIRLMRMWISIYSED